MVQAITQETDHSRTFMEAEVIVGSLNPKLKGWPNYFCLDPVGASYKAIDAHTSQRLRRWLCKKHKVPGKGTAPLPVPPPRRALWLIRAVRLVARLLLESLQLRMAILSHSRASRTIRSCIITRMRPLPPSAPIGKPVRKLESCRSIETFF